ncbi:hypothetical protein J6590_048674 [Homalodisca vitripennis]|nr:hypothetical protein J6590_048674 [Homalodisca vitripennis]
MDMDINGSLSILHRALAVFIPHILFCSTAYLLVEFEVPQDVDGSAQPRRVPATKTADVRSVVGRVCIADDRSTAPVSRGEELTAYFYCQLLPRSTDCAVNYCKEWVRGQRPLAHVSPFLIIPSFLKNLLIASLTGFSLYDAGTRTTFTLQSLNSGYDRHMQFKRNSSGVARRRYREMRVISPNHVIQQVVRSERGRHNNRKREYYAYTNQRLLVAQITKDQRDYVDLVGDYNRQNNPTDQFLEGAEIFQKNRPRAPRDIAPLDRTYLGKELS